MKKTEQKYQAFVQILKEELIPAMGCTEPISLAYGASIARKVLNHLPTKIVVEASGSIIKNVKSVIVPHTHHLKGIKAAVCAGIIGGNDDKYLEVLSQIDEKTKKEIDQYIEKVDFEEQLTDLKLRFFTDISHELRTPLTLISGSVEEIVERGQIQESGTENMQ